jgi:hypothetical protein
LNLLQKHPIIVVDDPVDLGVAGVGLDGHELLGELLVEIDLARLDDAAVVDCAVLCDGPVGVDLDVDVEGSADLVMDRWLVRDSRVVCHVGSK